MVASRDLKMPAYIRKRARLYTFYPGPVDAQWNLILAFTSRRARMAADASVIPNEKPVIHVSLPWDVRKTVPGMYL